MRRHRPLLAALIVALLLAAPATAFGESCTRIAVDPVWAPDPWFPSCWVLIVAVIVCRFGGSTADDPRQITVWTVYGEAYCID